MRKVFFISMLLISMATYAQNKIHYNFIINTTFMVNENFGNYDEYEEDSDWDIIVPRALLLRNGFNVTLNNFMTIGLNLGLDWHEDLQVLAIPYYINSKFTLLKGDNYKLYFGGGIGKLVKLGKAFERGKYYTVGIGSQIAMDKTHDFIFNIDFHQKKIEGFENGRLNSLSLGVGISFL
ncbi:MAG TPA: hypothetical protein VIN72_09430 [Lutibacter sp.]